MHSTISSMDFRATVQTALPLTSKNNLGITKLNDQKKVSEEKNLEKRAPSPSTSTSSTVKPPYSYIALSNNFKSDKSEF